MENGGNGMFNIRIEVRFRAGHRLLPPYNGKCNNVHGEGYTAIVEFERGFLDENGMVFDFGSIKTKVKNWIDENWDHRYICSKEDGLGDVLEDYNQKVFRLESNPTAENMAKYLYDLIKLSITPLVKRVGIIESFEDSIAYYEEEKIK